MSKNKTTIGSEGIYDARVLGVPKMLVLGFQHMFAMFGATVLVPLLTGLDIATTLLMAGLGTLFFHLVTKGKVPAFLGSSFAFLGGYGAIAPLAGANGMTQAQLLPYACIGVAVAGLLYLVVAALIKAVGVSKVMRFFPPVVTGPIIIAIGLSLCGSAKTNCDHNWLLALLALAIVIIFNIWGKGMAKIIPILLGVLGACAVAAVLALLCSSPVSVIEGTQENPITVEYLALFGNPKFQLFATSAIQNVKDAAWIGLPIHWEKTVFGGVDWKNGALIASSIIAIAPIALATMMEHIGDISAISSTTKRNFIEVFTARLSATALPPPLLPSSAVLPTQPTVKTPACLPSPRFTTRESSALPLALPSFSPSRRNSPLSLNSFRQPSSAVSPSSCTV